MPARSRPSATDSVGYLLKRAQSALNTSMSAALAGHGATLSQYAVLVALAEEPGLSNADLARRAFVTPQAMNQVLRELEHEQWVVRRPHPGHRRVLQAELTVDGQRVLRGCDAAVVEVQTRMLGGLPVAEQRQLARSLRTCAEALSSPEG